MVPGLAEFSNEEFYKGKLKDSTETAFASRPIACSVLNTLRGYFRLQVETTKALLNVPTGVTISTTSTSRLNRQSLAITLYFIAVIIGRYVLDVKYIIHDYADFLQSDAYRTLGKRPSTIFLQSANRASLRHDQRSAWGHGYHEINQSCQSPEHGSESTCHCNHAAQTRL